MLSTGQGYVYRLGDEYDPDLLTIEVSQLRVRAGSPYALLTASTLLPGARTLPGSSRVLMAEVWLMSDRSRASYAASLTKVIPSPTDATPIDFTAVIEEVAQRVMEEENAPIEVIHLDQSVAAPPIVPDLIAGLLPATKPTILYGAGGVGKSIFAATMAVAVQTGTPLFGWPVTQTEVLYLDWETDAHDIRTRVAAAAHGLGVPPPVLRYMSLVQPLDARVAQLARYVAENRIGLVIIDSVGMAMSTARDGGDASEQAIRFFRSLRSMGATVLAIDHVSGDDMRRAGAAKPYGSVYKWNSARSAYELRTRKDADITGSHLLLKHRKTNVGRLQPDLPLRLEWTNGTAVFHREDVALAPLPPLVNQITDLLSVAPATPRGLADLLSDGDQVVMELDVRRVLKHMITNGQAHSNVDGSIRLAQNPATG